MAYIDEWEYKIYDDGLTYTKTSFGNIAEVENHDDFFFCGNWSAAMREADRVISDKLRELLEREFCGGVEYYSGEFDGETFERDEDFEISVTWDSPTYSGFTADVEIDFDWEFITPLRTAKIEEAIQFRMADIDLEELISEAWHAGYYTLRDHCLFLPYDRHDCEDVDYALELIQEVTEFFENAGAAYIPSADELDDPLKLVGFSEGDIISAGEKWRLDTIDNRLLDRLEWCAENTTPLVPSDTGKILERVLTPAKDQQERQLANSYLYFELAAAVESTLLDTAA